MLTAVTFTYLRRPISYVSQKNLPSDFIGPLVMNSLLFAYFTGPEAQVYPPGAPMLLGALLAVFSAVLARRGLKKNLAAPVLEKVE